MYSGPTVVLVRSNEIIHDPRLRKTVRSLSQRYSISGLGWNRERVGVDKLRNYVIPIHCLNYPAPVGKPRLVLYYPLFWMWVFVQLAITRPRIVHACDLDTVIPCYCYTVICRRKLVFDLYDRYALAFIPDKHKLLYHFVNTVEEWFCRKTNVLIIVGDNVLPTFKRPLQRYIIIMNCPELHQIEQKNNNQLFTLAYTGNITPNRGLEKIAEAMRGLDRIQVEIAGKVTDKELLEKILELPNARYRGLLTPDQALRLEARSDVLIILYDLAIPINRIANPNKTFSAMMLGVPLITNVQSDLVLDVDCGIIVDYNDINEIRSAILSLRDNPELRRKLGENGRKAALEQYNWQEMEKRLFECYGSLIPTKSYKILNIASNNRHL